jgi:hypothetical protein
VSADEKERVRVSADEKERVGVNPEENGTVEVNTGIENEIRATRLRSLPLLSASFRGRRKQKTQHPFIDQTLHPRISKVKL